MYKKILFQYGAKNFVPYGNYNLRLNKKTRKTGGAIDDYLMSLINNVRLLNTSGRRKRKSNKTSVKRGGALKFIR